MKRVVDKTLITEYMHKYQLDKIFKTDIQKYMELFAFTKGELICSKDSELKYMYFLVEGKIKVYTLHDNGKSILLRFSHPLSILGDVELMTSFKVFCNVEAVSESMLLAIEIDKLRRYAFEDTVFLKYIIQSLSEKLYSTTNATSINLLYSLESRLASYLLSMKDSSMDCSEVNIPKLTEVAPLLGTSYRHLNRIVKELIKQGIIEKVRSKIIIKNLVKLKELSQGNIYESKIYHKGWIGNDGDIIFTSCWNLHKYSGGFQYPGQR